MPRKTNLLQSGKAAHFLHMCVCICDAENSRVRASIQIEVITFYQKIIKSTQFNWRWKELYSTQKCNAKFYATCTDRRTFNNINNNQKIVKYFFSMIITISDMVRILNKTESKEKKKQLQNTC